MIQYTNGAVTVFQSVLYQTTSTVVELGDAILIVDPAWLPGEVEAIRSYVDSVRRDKACYLLFTHGDFDHIIGYKAFPGAKTIGSAGLAEHPEKEHTLQIIRDFDARYYVTRDYPIEFPKLDIVIGEDGQEMMMGSTKLTFYLAPGHTAEGIFTLIDSAGLFVAGDYLSDFELPFIFDSAIAYEETIRKAKQIVQTHPVKLLVPGHGQCTEQLVEMERRVDMALGHLQRLKQAVIAGDEQALEQLRLEHGFVSPATDRCHRENISMMQKEYLKQGESGKI